MAGTPNHIHLFQEHSDDFNPQLTNEFEGKSDQEIWSAFKSGSEVSLIYIYKTYFQTLYRYGSQFTKDRALIKDAIQDLFIELLKKRNKLSNTSSIKFYLFKSLKINLLTKFKRNRLHYFEDNKGFDFEVSISFEEKLINAQLDQEKKRRINEALSKLKRKEREIIYYYYFEEMDLSQISAIMQFSNQKSSQNLLYRSLKKLKNSLTILYLIVFFRFFLLPF